MPIPTKPYRRRFPLSRKGRLAPPVMREYTSTFEFDPHDFKYSKDFLRTLGMSTHMTPRDIPLQKLLAGITALEGTTGVIRLRWHTDYAASAFIVQVTRRTRIGDKLRAYFANHHRF